MKFNVHKFGGASLKNSEGFKNVADICQNIIEGKNIIVASATSKSTNELEKVLAAHRSGADNTFELFNQFKLRHVSLIKDLLGENHPILAEVNDSIVEAEWTLEEEIHPDFDYEYDQLVCVGELISSKILFALLKEKGLNVVWLDAREVIVTDSIFREATVLWDKTAEKISTYINLVEESVDLVVTQGFIGSTPENETTTLGREGSDYSAAIFSYCLGASEMSIWKDVPGVLNADPNIFKEAVKIEKLSYREAVEMTYYGAKVIHPKTIKPLENKLIRLWVKSFVEPESSGTLISKETTEAYPPMIVMERNQVLIRISPKDFSFIAERHLSELFTLFNQHRIKVNMMQNTAISFSVCVNNIEERIENFIDDIKLKYNILLDQSLELITIRHYTDETVEEHKSGKIVLFEERLKDTVQMVVKKLA
jgi:aspartate kinase